MSRELDSIFNPNATEALRLNRIECATRALLDEIAERPRGHDFRERIRELAFAVYGDDRAKIRAVVDRLELPRL